MAFLVAIKLVLSFLLLTQLCVHLVDAGAVCTTRKVGKPQMRDCRALYGQLPFVDTGPSGAAQLAAPRLFVEPQFLFAPFSSVRNPYSQSSIVQLPKVWRSSE